jgi:hypothetical protein
MIEAKGKDRALFDLVIAGRISMYMVQNTTRHIITPTIRFHTLFRAFFFNLKRTS